MKLFTFKPVVFLTALATIPAAAQTTTSTTTNPPAKTPLEYLAAQEQVIEQEISPETAEGMNLKLEFRDEGILATQPAASGWESLRIPAVCAQQMYLKVTPDPIGGTTERSLENIKKKELKGFAREIKVKFVFKGVPQMKTLNECRTAAAKLDKADLEGKEKLYFAFAEAKEPAYITVGKNDVKNAAFEKLVAFADKKFCSTCFDQLVESMDEAEKLGFSDAVREHAKEQATGLMNALVEEANAATTTKELDAVRIKAGKFLASLKKGGLSSALDEDAKKSLKGDAVALLESGLMTRNREVCKAESTASTPVVASSSVLDGLYGYYQTEPTQVASKNQGEQCLKLDMDVLKDVSAIDGYSPGRKKLNLKIVQDMNTPNHPVRIKSLMAYNAAHPEVLKAKQTVGINYFQSRSALISQCGANPYRPEEFRIDPRGFRSESQYLYAVMQCGEMANGYRQQKQLAAGFGFPVQDPAPDSVGYDGFGASYRNTRAADPFSLNTDIFGQSATAMQNPAQYNSGFRYQQTNLDQYNRSAFPQNNNNVAIPRAANGLPVATPLGMPSV